MRKLMGASLGGRSIGDQLAGLMHKKYEGTINDDLVYETGRDQYTLFVRPQEGHEDDDDLIRFLFNMRGDDEGCALSLHFSIDDGISEFVLLVKVSEGKKMEFADGIGYGFILDVMEGK